MDKRVKTLIIAIAIALVVAIASTSYAFFTIGNKTGEETVITSGTMGLHLEDGPEVGLENAIPGTSVTKTFYVENTGNVATSYDLYLSEVVNTFVDKTDLVYTLTSNDGGYSTTGQVQAPSTPAKIVDAKPIAVGGIHHYTLVVTFLSKNENQDDNQGVEFSAKVQINEYKEAENNNGGGNGGNNPTPLPENVEIISGDTDTIGSEICIGSECFYLISKEANGDLKMLAKYNLNIGDNKVNDPEGIQSMSAIGWYDGGSSPYSASMKFSNYNYWDGVYNISIDDDVYGVGCNGYTYINNYVEYLSGYGVNVSGRNVNMEDLIDAVNGGEYLDSNPFGPFGDLNVKASQIEGREWIYGTSYWLSTTPAEDYLYVVESSGELTRSVYAQDGYYGFRPIIILHLNNN